MAIDPDTRCTPGLFAEGDAVLAADGRLLGQIAAILPSHDDPADLLVAPSGDAEDAAGEWRVPISAIAGCGPGRVTLGVTLDDARASGWLV